jgi:hypothetical protein
MVSRFVNASELVLKDQPAYKLLPRNAKTLAESNLRSAMAVVLDSPVMDPIFDCINALGDELEGLLPDAKRLDPNDNLAEQFLDLILDKIEEKIRRHFGGTKPSVTIAVRFSYIIPEVIITPAIRIPAKVITPAVHVPATPITPAFTIPAVKSPAVNVPAVIKPAQNINVNIPLGKIEINLNTIIDTMRNAIAASDYYHDALNNVVIKLSTSLAKDIESAALALQKMDAAKRQDSIRKIADELTNNPKQIKIITPKQFTKYPKDAVVEIQLVGVPASYLGLKTDEIQRVHIYLNGVSIVLKSLASNDVNSTASYTQIKFTVLQKDMTEGVNFLTVALIDKGGIMQKQNVSFMYTPVTGSNITNNITLVPKQLIIQKMADAKRYATDQHLLTFKNIGK